MTKLIECLKERGFVDALTSDDLITRLQKPTKIYYGVDPSADSLHVGNLMGIIVLRWMQLFGHTPVVILGGATGRIGDPSGKSVERPLLEKKIIDSNVKRISKHFENILDFSSPSVQPLLLNNEQWFANWNFIDFLRDVGKHFRLGSMLGKESVRARLHSEEGISFTEFSYQLLQAYDFYHLHCTYGVEVQIGGSDQWGNITAGIELIRKMQGTAVYGLTFPLLTRSDGKKFGKTEGGAVWLAADRFSPYEFYQYFVRVADADVIKMMRLLTFMPMEEIRSYEEQMRQKEYVPNTAQKRLAAELTTLVHGEESLKTALSATAAARPGALNDLDPLLLRKAVEEMPSVSLPAKEVLGAKFVDLLFKTGLVSSKSEGTRLIQNGGAYLNNQRVCDPQFCLEEKSIIEGEFLLIGAGKKKKLLISLTNTP